MKAVKDRNCVMKIGIIGAGSIGANAARLFTRAGHEVALSNSRPPESLKELIAELGEKARAKTIEEAAQFGDVVLVAIPFGKYKTLVANAFSNKVVVDATNYYPTRDGNYPELDNQQTTSSEMLASHLEKARLVKGFNTIYYQHLASQGNVSLPLAERRAIFIASNDSQAKAVVSKLIEEIGFAAVDTGTLPEGGRWQQPGSAIYNKTLTGKEAQAALKTI
ncbi:MAG TPA: NADP oxidoreductase [Cyanobacteria bacterium UBA11049]|nr:NADP oxidoreductase [Cyanobacteria bacterium UBA11049]